jgi:hypothetical protein
MPSVHAAPWPQVPDPDDLGLLPPPGYKSKITTLSAFEDGDLSG